MGKEKVDQEYQGQGSVQYQIRTGGSKGRQDSNEMFRWEFNRVAISGSSFQAERPVCLKTEEQQGGSWSQRAKGEGR